MRDHGRLGGDRPIFPPSIPFVIYAMISGASVGKLFLGGMVPAFILCIVMGIYVYFISKKRHYPVGDKVTFKQFAVSTAKALPALLTRRSCCSASTRES